MTQSSERIPPQDLEAERAAIGGVMIDPHAITQVLELLSVEDFYHEGHREIYRAALFLFERSEPIDLVTVTARLRELQKLDAVGGAAYLASLTDRVPTTANLTYYARIVHQQGMRRRLIAAATEVVQLGYDTSEMPIDDLLDRAEQIIFDIAQQKIRRSFFPIREVVKESFKAIERRYEQRQPTTGVPTGFVDLDRITSGLNPSDLIIVAGRPSMGKTAFALSMMSHAAIEAGASSAIFSLEMSKEQLVQRLLCAMAKVDSNRLRGGFLAESDWPKLTRVAGQLSDAPIFIDDTPAINVLEMRAKCRRLQREKGLGLIIVDYLQLMRGVGRPESREREISEISRSLKALAKELAVPVMALSQLNRAVEARQDKRPMMSDLRESGSLEQDADVIMSVYRDEMYNKDSPDAGIAEIIVAKQRNGPTGMVRLAFLKDYTRFDNLARDTGALPAPAGFSDG